MRFLLPKFTLYSRITYIHITKDIDPFVPYVSCIVFEKLVTLVKLQRTESWDLHRPPARGLVPPSGDELDFDGKLLNNGLDVQMFGKSIEAPLSGDEVKMVENLLLAREGTIESLMTPLQQVGTVFKFSVLER